MKLGVWWISSWREYDGYFWLSWYGVVIGQRFRLLERLARDSGFGRFYIIYLAWFLVITFI